ncbi:MAG: hypothetical protein PHU51_02235 [Candidatus Nanoarchaeia archaeon]|nr:hypothetical protein [Candidatus Nanoarchaeia archaeon]
MGSFEEYVKREYQLMHPNFIQRIAQSDLIQYSKDLILSVVPPKAETEKGSVEYFSEKIESVDKAIKQIDSTLKSLSKKLPRDEYPTNVPYI